MRSSGFSLFLVLALTIPAFSGTDEAPGRAYLALGDSVTFGFIANAGFEYVNSNNFIGFPNYTSRTLKLGDTNASCPGETTGSFLSSTAPDNGCRFFCSQAPLHVSYTSTQLDFAVSFLKSHPQTQMVTISLGADDVFCSKTPVLVTRLVLPRVCSRCLQMSSLTCRPFLPTFGPPVLKGRSC